VILATGLYILLLTFCSLFAVPALAEPALWTIKTPQATIYLFGVIHVLKPSTLWASPKIAHAIAASNDLWFEVVDVDPETVAPLLAKYGMDKNHPLSSKISKRELVRLDRAAKEQGLAGEKDLEPYAPWAVAFGLDSIPLTKAGYDPDKGADQVLQARWATGKRVHGFETADQHMRILATLSQRLQIQLIDEALDNAEEGPEKINELVNAWMAGDVSALDKSNQEMRKSSPELYDAIIVKRNQAWAQTITDLLKTAHGMSFIAVGAAHLTGPDSLQHALAAYHIAVERE
jgi:uncharacterized protein YbaP (TraB family)